MEEVEYLDDELEKLTAELQEKFDELKKKDKKLSAAQREEQAAYIFDRVQRAKDVLTNFRVELRQLLREAGREEHAIFEAKGKAYNQTVNKINTDTEVLKAAADKRELMKGAKKKKKGEEEEVDTKNQYVNEGKDIQVKSAAALDRTHKLVEEMGEIGTDTNLDLKRQTEQMSNTNADVVGVQNEMKRAGKVTRDIARRLATDKIIICLILILILVIIAVVVIKSLGWDLQGDGTIDCYLDITQTYAECQARNNASTVSSSRTPSDTNASATPSFTETPAPFPVSQPPSNSTNATGGARRMLLWELVRDAAEEAEAAAQGPGEP
mmetsp:Transcript_51920/g.129223  ORF Transcript_51920/g.129223 Transcript_51920/m.129223 type:complete len:324 (+) Transcript_51920:26-997(+)